MLNGSESGRMQFSALFLFLLLRLIRLSRAGKVQTGEEVALPSRQTGFSLYRIKSSVAATPADSSRRFQSFASGASVAKIGDRPTDYYFFHRGYGIIQDFEADNFVCHYDADISQLSTGIPRDQIAENVVFGKSRVYFVCDDRCCELDCCEINPWFIFILMLILGIICALLGYSSYYCMKEEQVNLRKFSTHVRRYSTSVQRTLSVRPGRFDAYSNTRGVEEEEEDPNEPLDSTDPRVIIDPYHRENGKSLVEGVYYQGKEGKGVEFYENPSHYGAVASRHFL